MVKIFSQCWLVVRACRITKYKICHSKLEKTFFIIWFVKNMHSQIAIFQT